MLKICLHFKFRLVPLKTTDIFAIMTLNMLVDAWLAPIIPNILFYLVLSLDFLNDSYVIHVGKNGFQYL